jgi:hypothetical protein
MSDLTKEQVGEWLTTLSDGYPSIQAWLTDPSNATSPFFQAITKLGTGVSDGVLLLQWLHLRLRRAEVLTEKAAIDAALAQLPTP